MFSFLIVLATLSSSETSPIDTIQLTEVTMVATPKERDGIRNLPLSFSQYSASYLETIDKSLQAALREPANLFMPDYGSRLTSAIYIRGIGSRINNPAVGLYVDNVPMVDKSSFNFNFYDVEYMDIMRGPQGTLYGRNTMGGLVRIYTRNPFHYQGTDVRLSYASGDNHRTISLAHYHRPTNNFAFSASGYYEMGDGFFKNDYTDKKADGVNAGGGRLRGVWKATNKLNFDLSVNYDYSDEKAYPYYYTGSVVIPRYDGMQTEYYPNLIGQISNNRESTYRRNLLNIGLNTEYNTSKTILNAVTGYQHLSDRMFMDQDFISADIYTLEQQQRINTFTQEVVLKNASPISNGKWQWNWINGINFMYQWLTTEAPVTFYDDGLRWLEGSINSLMPEVGEITMLKAMGFQKMAVNFRGEQMLLDGTYQTPMLNAAAFHESALTLNDSWTFTIGMRADFEQMKLKYNAPAEVPYRFVMTNGKNEKMSVDLQQLQSNILYDGNRTDHFLSLLPKLAIQYNWNQNTLYISTAMGRRSGGYNLQMFSDLLQGSLRIDMMQSIKEGVGQYLTALGDPTSSLYNPNMPTVIPDPDNNMEPIALANYVTRIMGNSMPVFEQPNIKQVAYKPETAWNYETGAHLATPDSRYKLDASIFFIDTRNQQIARYVASSMGRMMVNAGHSQSYGLETSAHASPIPALNMALSYGYTHATFKKYDDGQQDFSGNYVPFAPQHTLNADVAYNWFNVGPFSKLTLGASYNGTGQLYWTESNKTGDERSIAKQNYYSLLNARLQLVCNHVSIQLWGRNLTNTHYNSFYFESAGRGYEQHGKPIQIGVDVRLHF